MFSMTFTKKFQLQRVPIVVQEVKFFLIVYLAELLVSGDY